MSMTFYPARLEGNSYEPMIKGSFDDCPDLSDGNAAYVLGELGYEIAEGTFAAPLDGFIAACEKILARGAETPAIPTMVDEAPGRATIVYCGTPDGYLEAKVTLLLDLAREGKSLGAEYMTGA